MDKKAHTFSRRTKNVKKRTKTYEKRILCKFTFSIKLGDQDKSWHLIRSASNVQKHCVVGPKVKLLPCGLGSYGMARIQKSPLRLLFLRGRYDWMESAQEERLVIS